MQVNYITFGKSAVDEGKPLCPWIRPRTRVDETDGLLQVVGFDFPEETFALAVSHVFYEIAFEGSKMGSGTNSDWFIMVT